MPDQSQINDLLNDIEINCDPPVGSRPCTQFSVDRLLLIRDKLPPVAEEGTALLVAYLEGRVPLARVTDALDRCWQYLMTNHQHTSTLDPQVSAIRAVIFPLDAQKNAGERDIVEHLGTFLEFINTVEPHYDEVVALVRRHFADCLKPNGMSRNEALKS